MQISRRQTAIALNDQERDAAEAIAIRLRGELSKLLGEIERSGPSALALARDLKVDRNLSQRVLSALEVSNSELEFLAKIPGPEGLRAVVRSALRRAARTLRRSVGESAPELAAVDAFERLIWEIGGSQTRLNRRLQATPAQRTNLDPGLHDRDAVFQGAASLLGYSVDLILTVAAIRPRESQHELIDGCNVAGLIGLEGRPGRSDLVTLAMSSTNFRGTSDEIALEVRGSPLGSSPMGASGPFDRFCSQPLPLTSVAETDGAVRQVLDRASLGHGKVDFVVGNQWGPGENPMCMPASWWSQFVQIKRPAARLLLDVWLPETMAKRAVENIAAFSWAPGITAHPRRSWSERLPGSPTVKRLGSGLSVCSTCHYSRHPELTQQMFDSVGWDPSKFVCYRAEVVRPIWSAAYYMTFDF